MFVWIPFCKCVIEKVREKYSVRFFLHTSTSVLIQACAQKHSNIWMCTKVHIQMLECFPTFECTVVHLCVTVFSSQWRETSDCCLMIKPEVETPHLSSASTLLHILSPPSVCPLPLFLMFFSLSQTHDSEFAGDQQNKQLGLPRDDALGIDCATPSTFMPHYL